MLKKTIIWLGSATAVVLLMWLTHFAYYAHVRSNVLYEARSISSRLSTGGFDDKELIERIDIAIKNLWPYKDDTLDNDYADVTRTLGELHLQRAVAHEVKKDFAEAISDTGTAISCFRKIDHWNLLSAECYLIHLHEDNGDPQVSMQLCENLIRSYPATYKPFALYVYLGERHPDLANRKKMEEYAERAEQINPGDWRMTPKYVF